MTVPEDEKQLILACTRGGAEGWAAFVDRYSPFLYATIRKILAKRKGRFTPEEAEGVYQDVFWELFREEAKALRAFDGRSKLTTYLWVIAYRKTLEHVKGRRREERATSSLAEFQEPEAAGKGPSESAQVSEERARIRGALAELPENHRTVLTLFYFQGCSHGEIAEKTGLSPAAVGMLIFRARKKLEKILGKSEKPR